MGENRSSSNKTCSKTKSHILVHPKLISRRVFCSDKVVISIHRRRASSNNQWQTNQARKLQEVTDSLEFTHKTYTVYTTLNFINYNVILILSKSNCELACRTISARSDHHTCTVQCTYRVTAGWIWTLVCAQQLASHEQQRFLWHQYHTVSQRRGTQPYSQTHLDIQAHIHRDIKKQVVQLLQRDRASP